LEGSESSNDSSEESGNSMQAVDSAGVVNAEGLKEIAIDLVKGKATETASEKSNQTGAIA